MKQQTKKQKLRSIRRRAITMQNNSSRKITLTEAMKEVQNVQNDV